MSKILRNLHLTRISFGLATVALLALPVRWSMVKPPHWSIRLRIRAQACL